MDVVNVCCRSCSVAESVHVDGVFFPFLVCFEFLNMYFLGPQILVFAIKISDIENPYPKCNLKNIVQHFFDLADLKEFSAQKER